MNTIVTEQQFQEGIQTISNSIMKAVRDYPNNPEKAEEYIRRKVRDMAQAGILYSEISIVKEIFG
jgi:hypothetical protein